MSVKAFDLAFKRSRARLNQSALGLLNPTPKPRYRYDWKTEKWDPLFTVDLTPARIPFLSWDILD